MAERKVTHINLVGGSGTVGAASPSRKRKMKSKPRPKKASKAATTRHERARGRSPR